jgi:carbonic anhydrase/acetyltransferase-like protein (isoleucine patch superfamily)
VRIAIVGWEEGLAGQVSTWIETAMQCSIEYYVHPNDTFPIISAKDALARPAKNFSFPVNGMYLNLPMIISKDWLKRLAELNIEGVVCCLSNSQERESIYRELVKSDIALLTAVHPSAQVLGGAEIKPGCILEPNTYVGYRAEIGVCTHVKVGSQVDHHSVVGDFSEIGPGALIAGNVLVGEHSKIHLGSTIINRVSVPRNTTVGAGANVVKTYQDEGLTLIGNPAKPMSK